MNTTHKKNKIATAVSCAYISLALSPVYASDVEIYTQAVANANVSPVVMMMFDTSGSMAWCLDSGSSCSSPNRRQDVLKSAMNTILNGGGSTTPAPGYIKMGLSRYQSNAQRYTYQNSSGKDVTVNFDGGWVTYPARPLDAFVAINPDGFVTSTGASAEANTSTDSLVINNSDSIGLYFPNIKVPLGATITEAKIILVAKSNSTGGATLWQPAIENTGDALPFSVSAPLNSSSRNFVNAVSTVEMEPWVAEQSYDVDVKGLVQSVAKDNASWCGGNAMAFRLRNVDSSGRTAYAGAIDTAKAAQLKVTFTIDPNKKDSCIAPAVDTEYTSTFVLGGNPVNTTQLPLDDVEITQGTGVVDSDNSTLSINSVTSGVRNEALLRLTTAAPIGTKATITSAVLTITPSATYPIVKEICKTTNSNGTCKTSFNPKQYSTTNPPKPTTIGLLDNLALPAICSATTTCTVPSMNLKGTPVVLNQSSFTKDVPINIDVKDMMQALAPQTGITKVSSVGFVLANQSNTNAESSTAAIYSGNSSTSKAAKLTVKWRAKVTDLSTFTTVRKELWNTINALSFPSATPLGAAYSEVSRYMYGLQPYYQDPKHDQPDSRTVTGSGSSQRYISPIQGDSQCSGNFIFLLTDGAPTIDAGVNNNNKGMTGHDCKVSAADEAILMGKTQVFNSDGTPKKSGGKLVYTDNYDAQEKLNWRCILDLAETNNKTTLHTGNISHVTVPIKTSTVILGPEGGGSEIQMRRTAAIGGGSYTKATDTQALVDAMTRTINSALDQSGILASPGVAINQFNRLNTLDQVYYVLFDPSSMSKRWDGNLKRYKLDLKNEAIKDVNGNNAVTEDGSFKKDSQSWWSENIDGSSSTVGGAAGVLPAPNSRKIFTYVDDTKTDLDSVSLTNTTFVNKAKALLPSLSTSSFNNLVNWFKGYDLDVYGSEITDLTNVSTRQKLGGGLHSKATMVNYGFTGTTAADALDPDKQNNIIFFSTLGATLHGVEANTGEEVFAFIPGEKIPAIKTLYDNASAVEPEYGMDLTWSVYRKDKNMDGQINPANNSGDKLYMYGGMRMGGRNYYGLDLTTLTSPKMLFSIIGGSSGSYANLGQTWSQPVLADIKIGSVVKSVLVFGGGYDECYENATCTTTQKGNQLYIVDAVTGELYWWASSDANATKVVSDMTNSIPSQPRIMDVNSDGLTDTIYFGDLGGQLFRADIDNGKAADSIVKRVKLVAKLGSNGVSSATTADNRRIYEPPTVAFFRDTTLNKVFGAVAVGTGNRSRPLNTMVQDRFATIFDFDITRSDILTAADTSLQPTALFSNMKAIDLTVDNSTGTPSYAVDGAGKKSLSQYGWYVDLISNGEKSLSTGIIFLNKLMFTTYSPETAQSGCTVVAGSTNLYEMCMPYGNQCSNTNGTAIPRRKASIVTGLGSEPQIVIQPSDAAVDPDITLGVLIKTELEKDKELGKKVFTPVHRWREKTRFPAQ